MAHKYWGRKDIKLVNKECPKCLHMKAWSKNNGIQCSRCGYFLTKEDLMEIEERQKRLKEKKSLRSRIMEYARRVQNRMKKCH